MTSIFEPFDLNGRLLANRIVMAPMTRARRPDGVADDETALYYQQRATAGLIVTEGTPVSHEAQGNILLPGIWSSAQVDGWRRVTTAVHERGGAIFAQLWHVGRVSHTSLQPDGNAPVSSTAIPARDQTSKVFIFGESGEPTFAEPSVPRAIEDGEVARIVSDFVKAAANAVEAGFDGIEIHAANGYLFEQFLNPVLNNRGGSYGGSLDNRVRLLLEAVDAIAERIGSRKIGIRLAPFNRQFDMPAYDATETYLHLGHELSKRDVAYIHLNDNHARGVSVIDEDFLRAFRGAFDGTVILAGGMTKIRARELVERGLIDLPAFGQPFISNPDLVTRLQNDFPLTVPERATYYGEGSNGYTDYPAFKPD